MTDHVVLLHGIWLRGFTLGLLARRLRAAGHEVSCYDYASVTRSPDEGLARVGEYVAALPPGRVHMVGHSLGGLLALTLAERGLDRELGRIVCLGTPLRGSAVARVMAAWSPLRWTLGEAGDLLCRGLPDRPRAEVGVIAGRLPVGFGMLVPALTQPHDGTVSVNETHIEGLADHAVVDTTHSGLLLSDRVARMTAHFLAHGRFPDTARGQGDAAGGDAAPAAGARPPADDAGRPTAPGC